MYMLLCDNPLTIYGSPKQTKYLCIAELVSGIRVRVGSVTCEKSNQLFRRLEPARLRERPTLCRKTVRSISYAYNCYIFPPFLDSSANFRSSNNSIPGHQAYRATKPIRWDVNNPRCSR